MWLLYTSTEQVEHGMPYGFQNGLFFASFYHFYLNDRFGSIGRHLRRIVSMIPAVMNLNELVFPVFLVSSFMQTVAILQLPIFLGPSFSPFTSIFNIRRGKALSTKPLSAVTATAEKPNGATLVRNANVKEQHGKHNVVFQETKIEPMKGNTPQKRKKKKQT